MMGIGTSQGAFYEDSFHQAAAQWDPKYDDNVVTPDQVDQNKQLNNVEMTELGGIEVKDQMPFPDNNNPNTDFTNRFGNLPPSGVLNDLKKPTDPSPPLVRKISDVDGNEFDYSEVGNTPLPDLPTKKDDPSVGGYMNWLDKNKLKDDKYDYDLQGAYAAGVNPSENGHLPDTFKKPNHPTFSDESMFHGGVLKQQDGSDYVPEGGHWDKNTDGSYNFTPGKSNLDHNTVQELLDYFKKNEPNNHLILPESKNDKGLPVVKAAYLGNLTNTPDEVMAGVEMSHSYPQGYGSAGPTQTPEKIKSAALRNADNGEVFTGQTHGHAFDKLMDKYPSETNFGKIDQGFTTTHGRFVSREEAFGIAQDAKQFTDKGVPPIKAFGLLSEDIQ